MAHHMPPDSAPVYSVLCRVFPGLYPLSSVHYTIPLSTQFIAYVPCPVFPLSLSPLSTISCALSPVIYLLFLTPVVSVPCSLVSASRLFPSQFPVHCPLCLLFPYAVPLSDGYPCLSVHCSPSCPLPHVPYLPPPLSLVLSDVYCPLLRYI